MYFSAYSDINNDPNVQGTIIFSQEDYQNLRSLIEIPQTKRPEKLVSSMLDTIQKLGQFRQIGLEKGLDLLKHMIIRFQVVKCQQGEVILQHSKTMDKFFFQLEGVTKVTEYKPRVITEQQKMTNELSPRDKEQQAKEMQKQLVEKFTPKSKITRKTQYNNDSLSIEKFRALYEINQNECYQGYVFGEWYGTSQSTMLITAQTECLFAVYTKSDFKQYEANCVEIEKRERYKFLSNHRAFTRLPHDLLMKILQLLHLQHYFKNQLVYKEGDPCDCIYFVKRGEYKMDKKIQPSTRGYQLEDLFIQKHDRPYWIEISVLQEGELFGNEETELFKGRLYQVKCSSSRGQLYCLNQKLITNLFLSLNIPFEESTLFWQSTQSYKSQIYLQREEQIRKIKENQQPLNTQNQHLGHLRKFGKAQVGSEDDKANYWLITKQIKTFQTQIAGTIPSAGQVQSDFFYNYKQEKGTIRKNVSAKPTIHSFIQNLSNRVDQKESLLKKKGSFINQNEFSNMVQQNVNIVKAQIEQIKNPISFRKKLEAQVLKKSSQTQRMNRTYHSSRRREDQLPFMAQETDYFQQIQILRKLGYKQIQNYPKSNLDLSQLIMMDLTSKLSDTSSYE